MLKKRVGKYLGILILAAYLFLPQVGSASNSIMNFLPMEDALSTSRNEVTLKNIDIKPYRTVVSFKQQPSEKINLGNIDIFAFVLLAIVFFIISRRNSKSRKINL